MSITEIPAWRRWLPRLGTLTATVTTLCCLGVTAVLSLMTALGATFMTDDAYLRPLLAATLVLTALGSSLTFLAHRNPVPLLVTVASGAWVFVTLFAGTLFGHGDPGDASSGDHSTDNPWAWSGLAVLIAAQVWDLWIVRRRRTSAT